MKRAELLIIAFLGVLSVNAQSVSPEVIASSGDHYMQTNAQLSWTIGEVIIETFTATNSIITQGFHQHEEESIPGFENNLPAYLGVHIYPNPSTEFIIVELENNGMHLTVELFDMTGKLVGYKSVPAFQNKVELNVREFANANYLLRINFMNNKYVASYSIQKTQ